MLYPEGMVYVLKSLYKIGREEVCYTQCHHNVNLNLKNNRLFGLCFLQDYFCRIKVIQSKFKHCIFDMNFPMQILLKLRKSREKTNEMPRSVANIWVVEVILNVAHHNESNFLDSAHCIS